MLKFTFLSLTYTNDVNYIQVSVGNTEYNDTDTAYGDDIAYGDDTAYNDDTA
jgi:hypothetical protein